MTRRCSRHRHAAPRSYLLYHLLVCPAADGQGRQTAMVSFVAATLLALFASTQQAPPSASPCGFEFVPDADTGHFVATAIAAECRDRVIARDFARLLPNRTLRRIMSGSVSLASAAIDRSAESRGVRAYRWHVTLPVAMQVPASVSTRFTRAEASLPDGPDRIIKCNITPLGFDLIVVEDPRSQLYELEIEWIAYEFEPPATPLTCNEPAF